MIKFLRALCFLVYDQGHGISMGEMLTVNFRQPSHEFTFNVGIDLLF
jgi:hypothetical protein